MIVKHSQRWKLLQTVITQGSRLCLPPPGNPSAVLRIVALLPLNALASLGVALAVRPADCEWQIRT